MDKSLTVYPIASGDMLNIFANDNFADIRIMDMEGNVAISSINIEHNQWQIDITNLQRATYIVEVVYVSGKTARSVFVKM